MMKCGHAANAEDSEHNPVCVICIGIDPSAKIIDDNPPDLSKREAKCDYCGHKAKSNPGKLAFFAHKPEKEFDEYYCGCRGWD